LQPTRNTSAYITSYFISSSESFRNGEPRNYLPLLNVHETIADIRFKNPLRASDGSGTISTVGTAKIPQNVAGTGRIRTMFAVAACFTNTANAYGTWVKDKETCREKGERPCSRQKYYEFSKDDSTLQQRLKMTDLAREYKHKQLPPDLADRKKVKDARDFCLQHGMGRDCSNYNLQKDSLKNPQKPDHNPKTEAKKKGESKEQPPKTRPPSSRPPCSPSRLVSRGRHVRRRGLFHKYGQCRWLLGER